MDRSNIIAGSDDAKRGGEEFAAYLVSADKDVELAAQQLMQLSDEDTSSINERRGRKKKGRFGFPPVSVACAKKIEEIFGSEGEDDDAGEVVEAGEVCESKKKRRKRKSRSLEDIYRVTKPVDNEIERYFNGKEIIY